MRRVTALLPFRYLFLPIILVIAYGNILNHEFVWDDLVLIVHNPLLQKLSNIPRFFLLEDKFELATGYYRPLAYASFAVDHALWGNNPVGFNITNLLLHVAAATIFYRVAVVISGSEAKGMIAALLFSLHPVAVETVNFHAGGRNTLLCATFGLLSFLFFMREKHASATICLTMSIFSKEFGLLLPVIFFLYDHQFQRKIRPPAYLLYLLPVTVYFVLRSLAISDANILKKLYFSEELLVTPYLVIRYLLNMLFPFQLKVIYDTQTEKYIALMCFAGLVALLGILIFYRKKSPIFFPACWFFLFLLPVANIIPLNTPLLMADRYAYFSLMGFSLAISMVVCRLNRRLSLATAFLLVTAYAVTTIKTNEVWKNEVSLYERMIKDDPQNYFGAQNLGTFYYGKGEPEKASHYLAMASSLPYLPSEYLVGNASVLWETGRLDMTEEILLRIVETERSNPEPYLMLEMLYRQKGNVLKAALYRDRASAVFPDLERLKVRIADEYIRSAEQFIGQRQSVLAKNILWRARLLNPGATGAEEMAKHMERQTKRRELTTE